MIGAESNRKGVGFGGPEARTWAGPWCALCGLSPGTQPVEGFVSISIQLQLQMVQVIEILIISPSKKQTATYSREYLESVSNARRVFWPGYRGLDGQRFLPPDRLAPPLALALGTWHPLPISVECPAGVLFNREAHWKSVPWHMLLLDDLPRRHLCPSLFKKSAQEDKGAAVGKRGLR
jgi:hypothetical protein